MTLSDVYVLVYKKMTALSAEESSAEEEAWAATNCQRLDEQRRNDNIWLLHPDLDDARVALSQTFDKLRRCEEWTQDLDIFWNNLNRITTAHSLMSSEMQLPVARREAQAGIDTATAVSYTHLRAHET